MALSLNFDKVTKIKVEGEMVRKCIPSVEWRSLKGETWEECVKNYKEENTSVTMSNKRR